MKTRIASFTLRLAAYPQGNYEVVSARCEAGSGERLVEAALALLEQLKQP